MPVKIFFCYAHEDEPLLNKLKSHLKPLQRQGLIEVWHDRDISAGTEWEREVSEQLNSAQIVLLLVSPDFMNSDYCYGIEMKRALERHDRGEAQVIPLILRPVYWQGEPLGKLQALPTDAIPVTSPKWHDLDGAFFDVVESIRKVIMKLPSRVPPSSMVKPEESALQDETQLRNKLSTKKRITFISSLAIIVVATIAVVLGPTLFKPVGQTSPTPTPRPTTAATFSEPMPTAYPPAGWKLVLSDPLKSNSSGYWHVSAHGLAGNDGICTFTGGVYQVITIIGLWHRCDNAYYDFTDFALEVQMTIVNGDQGGIEFRRDDQTANHYFFWISSAGTYGLEIWGNDTLSHVLSSGSSAAIHNGLNHPNTVAVVAQGNTFKLYVNNQLIDTVIDKNRSYSHGRIALEAFSVSNVTEVHFSNVRVWTPPS